MPFIPLFMNFKKALVAIYCSLLFLPQISKSQSKDEQYLIVGTYTRPNTKNPSEGIEASSRVLSIGTEEGGETSAAGQTADEVGKLATSSSRPTVEAKDSSESGASDSYGNDDISADSWLVVAWFAIDKTC